MSVHKEQAGFSPTYSSGVTKLRILIKLYFFKSSISFKSVLEEVTNRVHSITTSVSTKERTYISVSHQHTGGVGCTASNHIFQ